MVLESNTPTLELTVIQIPYLPFYTYYELSLAKEEMRMAFGNVDGAACCCDHGKGVGSGIAAVVIIILLLIAMGIVF
jgi:hypothetical protein